ncbi:hypothetical protein ETD86_37095 [Nonomuraea turkmeniaca]|uniref:Uncharacterized protein n=1 Tax=Nonomuraea turkmeniaca TaxID=103838 RepID=A0A5S4FPF7_9ACTN|nr:hypothetical protein [Nonomuraea turkmeniaca]TMR11063.1 hypothetical protein ETD86_37095 [Nonomuraea turkmeniaca]
MRFDVVVFELECTACGAYCEHRYDGEETACTSCGTPREVDPELIAAVLDMRPCAWCRETLPANHTCRPDEPSCESPAHLYPDRCGICPTDLALQERSIAARAEAAAVQDVTLYGSPSDIDIP